MPDWSDTLLAYHNYQMLNPNTSEDYSKRLGYFFGSAGWTPEIAQAVFFGRNATRLHEERVHLANFLGAGIEPTQEEWENLQTRSSHLAVNEMDVFISEQTGDMSNWLASVSANMAKQDNLRESTLGSGKASQLQTFMLGYVSEKYGRDEGLIGLNVAPQYYQEALRKGIESLIDQYLDFTQQVEANTVAIDTFKGLLNDLLGGREFNELSRHERNTYKQVEEAGPHGVVSVGGRTGINTTKLPDTPIGEFNPSESIHFKSRGDVFRTVFRNAKGQFAQQKSEYAKQVEKIIRKAALVQYAQLFKSGDKNAEQRTGALREAIEKGELVQNSKQNPKESPLSELFNLKVFGKYSFQLADIERPSRPGWGGDASNNSLGDDPSVPVRFYAPIVFGGRDPIYARSLNGMRFFYNGGRRIVFFVRGAEAKNPFEWDARMQEEIMKDITALVTGEQTNAT